jgi:hypothetical protein
MQSKTMAVAALAAVVFAGGCPSQSDSPDGMGDPAGVLTPEQRDAAIDRAWNQYRSLSWEDPIADAQALVAFLKRQPEFSDAGISTDLTVWARFTDGLIYGLVTNDPDLRADLSADPAMRGLDGDGEKALENLRKIAPRNSGATPTLALPAQTQAHLLHGFFNDRPNINDQIEQMLTKVGGYRVNKGPLTLSALQAVQGGTGLLVTNGHGGKCPDPLDMSREHFYLVTNNAVPPGQPSSGEPLFDDWQTGRICLWGTVEANRVIGVGPGWVQNHMNFGTDSLWINNACMGFDAEFRDAAFHKSLGAYVGWDECTLRWPTRRHCFWRIG